MQHMEGVGGLRGEQCQCLDTLWNLTFWPLLYFKVALVELPFYKPGFVVSVYVFFPTAETFPHLVGNSF